MKQFFFFFFFGLTFCIHGQSFSTISKKTNSYSKTISLENLVKKISTDFSTKEAQVKASFYWITQNITYDLDAYYNPKNKRIKFSYTNEADKQQKINAIKTKLVKETLKNRKAVCEGYAQTLAKICSLLDIKNEVIKGYVKNSSQEINKPRSTPNHAWNAVFINNKWHYIDATWAAGLVINGHWQKHFNSYYYKIPASNYFKTHFPKSGIWQSKIGSFSKTAFYQQPIYNNSFLQNNLQLISPKTGIVSIKNDSIKVTLKNVKSPAKIGFGFLGHKYAIRPNIQKKGTLTTLSAKVPFNSSTAYLLINREVAVEFLIKK